MTAGGGATVPAAAPETAGAPLTDAMPQLMAALQQIVVALQQLVATMQEGTGGTPPTAVQAENGAAAFGGPAQFPVQSPVHAPVQVPTKGGTQDTPASKPGAPSKFRIASFNTLGASHTAANGNKPQLASGADRTKGAIATLKKHKIDVGGLQEFQPSQQKAFKKANTGYAMETQGANSIIWKKDRFRKVASKTVTVPYFEGHETKMPIVQLEDKATGKKAWFINIHNPADTANHHKQGAYRTEAVKREQAMIAELKKSGLPVFIVGDFNDHTTVRQSMTTKAGMTASAPAKHQRIDQIFGTGSMKFSGNLVDTSTQSQNISDHAIVAADAQI